MALGIEIATLGRVLLGSRHRFVIKILVMFIGGNLARLAAETVWINMLKTEDFSTKKFQICYGFGAAALLLFNVGHWMFAHKYFSMSRQLPLKLVNIKVPRFIVICDNITNWIFLSLNSIPPILYGVGFIGYFQADSNGNTEVVKKFRAMGRICYQIA